MFANVAVAPEATQKTPPRPSWPMLNGFEAVSKAPPSLTRIAFPFEFRVLPTWPWTVDVAVQREPAPLTRSVWPLPFQPTLVRPVAVSVAPFVRHTKDASPLARPTFASSATVHVPPSSVRWPRASVCQLFAVHVCAPSANTNGASEPGEKTKAPVVRSASVAYCPDAAAGPIRASSAGPGRPPDQLPGVDSRWSPAAPVKVAAAPPRAQAAQRSVPSRVVPFMVILLSVQGPRA